jgi:hypothetical protein
VEWVETNDGLPTKDVGLSKKLERDALGSDIRLVSTCKHLKHLQ